MENTAATQSPFIQEYWPQLAPPKEAYLFFPKTEDLYKGKENKILRYFFEGDIKYDEYEYFRIERLHKHLGEKKQTEVANGWSDADLIRWINGNQFESGKARKSMLEHNEWKKQFPLRYDDDIQRFMNTGFLYITGRDHRFRPIVVMNISKVNAKEQTAEFLLKGIDYFCSSVASYALLPGQIESWVFIMDFNKAGLSDLPISTFKKIISYMSDHYKFRLYRLYVVNCTKAITVPWGLVKIMLEEDTVLKINFIHGPIPEGLSELANAEQYEKRFGGNQPDRDENTKNFWPPTLPQSNFFLPSDKPAELLLSVQDYQSKFKDNSTTKYKVSSELLQPDVSVSFESLSINAGTQNAEGAPQAQ